MTDKPKTCSRCPHKGSKRGCPAWIGPEAGIVEANVKTGEERLMEGCFYTVIPRLMTHVIQASNRPAAAVESLRNEMVGAFDTLRLVATDSAAMKLLTNGKRKP